MIDYEDEQIKRDLYFTSWVHDTIDNGKFQSKTFLLAAHCQPDEPVSYPAYINAK